MAINYSLAKLKNKFGESEDGKFYARSQVKDTVSLKEFSQLIASQTTVSRADVSAVLISSVENLVRELQRGNQIEFGELGKFRLQLMSSGCEKAADFTANNIKGVRIQFVPGDDLVDMFEKLEFNPVASRSIQRAAYKAEKEGAKIVDISAAKANGKKDDAGTDNPQPDKGGTPSQGGNSGQGSNPSQGGNTDKDNTGDTDSSEAE